MTCRDRGNARGGGGVGTPKKNGVDTFVEMGSSTHVGPFQTEILEGKISQAPVCDTHVMVTPVGQAWIEAGQGTSATPWVASAAYLHNHNGWPQTNIDSGAEHDRPSHISEKRGPEWHTL